MLRNALQHHQAGRLTEAERIYRQILAIDAHQPDSLHLLGMIAYEGGAHEAAVDMIRQAIAIDGKQAAYHSNLATVLRAQGNLDEAAACCKRALALNPGLVEVHTNFGNILQAQGKLDEAVACQQRALALKPDCAEAYYNLGIARQAQSKLDEAVACYERALTLKPDYAEAHGNLGTALQAQGKLDEAVASYERALALKPDYAKAHGNLGIVLQAQDKLDEAVACYERALALKPDYAEVGTTLAPPATPRTNWIKLWPVMSARWPSSRTIPRPTTICGCVLYSLGNVDEALVRHRRALALQPEYPQARFSESLAQLFKGDFAAGWRNYESRWQTKEHNTPMRAYPQPLWKGEKLASGRLLIWGEQGVGDEIMFAGLIPDVVRTGSPCVLDCDARLKPLFARSFPGIDVVSGGDPGHNPQFDIAAHLPCGSLPGLFRVTNAAFAATTSPYLLADPLERERFRTQYADGRRLIGLAWYTKNRQTGSSRSIDLSLFAPLFARPDIRWVSLQYGDHNALEDQAAAASAPIVIDRSVDQLSDIDRFAAQIAAMDMVITIDNSTAHLAGALGVSTWLLLPFAPNWRWLQSRDDSPWYPTLRLFQQPKLGDWQSVVERVSSGL